MPRKKLPHNDIESARRKRGIRAIIALQKMADLVESRETAGEAWDGMTAKERDKTLAAYALFVNQGASA